MIATKSAKFLSSSWDLHFSKPASKSKKYFVGNNAQRNIVQNKVAKIIMSVVEPDFELSKPDARISTPTATFCKITPAQVQNNLFSPCQSFSI